MKTITITTLLGALALGAGCAHEPSEDLKTARSLYSEAQQGPASSLAQADLYAAKKALDKAESLEERKRGSVLEQDLAYIAARKAQHAMATAELKIAAEDEREAVAMRTEVLEAQRNQSREQLAERERALEEKEEKLRETKAEQAELRHRLDDAMASLSDLAELKDQEGRMVITLNGSVLFKTASANLLPTAQRRLEEVASVLQEYDDDNAIVVEGHTDDRGSKDYNATLSLHRAQAVEEFLEGQGVSDGALRAVGRGESEPIANNDSPEGRANNRRVEIIIDKKAVASR